MAPGIGGPNLDLQPLNSCPFEGAVAPPIQTGRMPVAAKLRGRWLVTILIAIVAIGVTLLMFPDEVRNRTGDIFSGLTPLFESSSRSGTTVQPARLVIESQKGFVNEPLPLGVSLNHASGQETVTLAGLTAGTKLSVGTPLGLSGWRVSARDIGNAMVHAPREFVGVMDVAMDLHSAGDRLMDSRVIRLEWIEKRPAPSAVRPDPSNPPVAIQMLDPEQLATLTDHFLKNGDIASARLLLKRAANAGNAKAALELGMTFDPVFLNERGFLGTVPDVAQARAWYERAMELGAPEASRLLEGLIRARR